MAIFYHSNRRTLVTYLWNVLRNGIDSVDWDNAD